MKQFERYNVLYKDLQRTDADESTEAQAEAKEIVRWDICVQSWPQHFVQSSVYGPNNEQEVEAWQKFRVSLKGQSTQMKLYRLKELYIEKCYRLESKEHWARWKCRIDNYIGALVRGGQLDTGLRIVR